jgi:hypothetical protein
MVYPPRESLVNMLLKRSQSADMLDAKFQQVFGRIPYHAWMKGGMLRLMPVAIDVR